VSVKQAQPLETIDGQSLEASVRYEGGQYLGPADRQGQAIAAVVSFSPELV
jgi:hypothetical protein